MTGLLALDVGSTLGWAHGDLTDPWPTDIGSLKLPGSSVVDLLGSRMSVLDLWLGRILREMPIEAVVMAERFRSRTIGESATNFGLDALVRMNCFRQEIQMLCQPENTVRKEILGRGSGKSEVMKALATEFCELHGSHVANDHEADAVVLWCWAQREICRQQTGTTESVSQSNKTPRVVAKKQRKNVAGKSREARLKAAAMPV